MNTFATARVAPEKAVFRPALPLCFQPGITEMRMATMTYREQIRHPNWQRKRLEVMQAADYSCENCGEKERTLNVHHRRYVKGRMVWEYERPDLVCLCEQCHIDEHELKELLDLLLAAGGVGALRDAIALLGGWMEGNLEIDDPALSDAARQVGSPLFDFAVFGTMLNQYPDTMLALLKSAAPQRLNPAQEAAVDRWKAFVKAMEESGL